MQLSHWHLLAGMIKQHFFKFKLNFFIKLDLVGSDMLYICLLQSAGILGTWLHCNRNYSEAKRL